MSRYAMVMSPVLSRMAALSLSMLENPRQPPEPADAGWHVPGEPATVGKGRGCLASRPVLSARGRRVCRSGRHAVETDRIGEKRGKIECTHGVTPFSSKSLRGPPFRPDRFHAPPGTRQVAPLGQDSHGDAPPTLQGAGAASRGRYDEAAPQFTFAASPNVGPISRLRTRSAMESRSVASRLRITSVEPDSLASTGKPAAG